MVVTYSPLMVRRILAAAAVAVTTLVITGSASAQSPYPGWPGTDMPFVEPSTSGVWDSIDCFLVRGKKCSCTMTRGAK